MLSEQTIHAQFMAQRIKTPHATALRTESASISYAELDDRSTALAGHLIQRGVNPGDKIGVYLHKGISLIVTLLGILKVGASYVPLDPSYPQQRLLYIAHHANVRFIITESAYTSTILDSNNEIDITKLDLNFPYLPPLPEVTGDALCYVMYTSGSTGQPKGVMVGHRTVMNYLRWMHNSFKITPYDVVLNQSTFSFDVSVWEIFWPLITGASCALITDEIKYDPHQLINFMRHQRVTVAQFVPTALRAIVAAQALYSCNELRHIFSGGEALDQKLVDDLAAQFSGHIHNLYGPTEATIFACHWQCQPGATSTMVPIGAPLPYVRAYILDDQGNVLPPGNAGELYLAGDTLAKGYINAPELTRNSFVRELFAADAPGLMYKTGDIVQARADGALEFLGRIDSQIKLRGHRVELHETEAILRNYNKLSNAAIIVKAPTQTRDTELVAFYVVKENQNVLDSELKEYLLKLLPFYMVPSCFIEQAFIPTLPNGKVDNNALRHIIKKGLDYMIKNIASPSSKIESKIIEIWEKILNNKNLSIHENFFDAGGNSLLMSKVHRELKKILPTPVSIVDLFQYPTVKTLSHFLTEKGMLPDTDNQLNGAATHE